VPRAKKILAGDFEIGSCKWREMKLPPKLCRFPPQNLFPPRPRSVLPAKKGSSRQNKDDSSRVHFISPAISSLPPKLSPSVDGQTDLSPLLTNECDKAYHHFLGGIPPWFKVNEISIWRVDRFGFGHKIATFNNNKQQKQATNAATSDERQHHVAAAAYDTSYPPINQQY